MQLPFPPHTKTPPWDQECVKNSPQVLLVDVTVTPKLLFVCVFHWIWERSGVVEYLELQLPEIFVEICEEC